MEVQIVVAEEEKTPKVPISKRELQIIEATTEGLTSREIAERLGIDYKTVEVHRHRVLQRLNCRNTPQLVRLLCRQGLLI